MSACHLLTINILCSVFSPLSPSVSLSLSSFKFSSCCVASIVWSVFLFAVSRTEILPGLPADDAGSQSIHAFLWWCSTTCLFLVYFNSIFCLFALFFCCWPKVPIVPTENKDRFKCNVRARLLLLQPINIQNMICTHRLTLPFKSKPQAALE